jgi:hypothetical protein
MAGYGIVATQTRRGLMQASASSVRRIREIRPASGVPFRPLIAVCRNPSSIFYHAGHVQEIPSHERGIAIREIVFRAA